MNTVESKLARWVDLYDQLKAARMRLKEAEAPAAPDLEDEVRRLTRMAGVALDQVTQEHKRQKEADLA